MEGLHNPYIKAGYFGCFSIYFLGKNGGIGRVGLLDWKPNQRPTAGLISQILTFDDSMVWFFEECPRRNIRWKAGNVGRHPPPKKNVFTQKPSEMFWWQNPRVVDI